MLRLTWRTLCGKVGEFVVLRRRREENETGRKTMKGLPDVRDCTGSSNDLTPSEHCNTRHETCLTF